MKGSMRWEACAGWTSFVRETIWTCAMEIASNRLDEVSVLVRARDSFESDGFWVVSTDKLVHKALVLLHVILSYSDF